MEKTRKTPSTFTATAPVEGFGHEALFEEHRLLLFKYEAPKACSTVQQLQLQIIGVVVGFRTANDQLRQGPNADSKLDSIVEWCPKGDQHAMPEAYTYQVEDKC